MKPIEKIKIKRKICSKCNFPTPRNCICKSLPSPPLSLSKCRIVVLQHPHEFKKKNRSFPLIRLCIPSMNDIVPLVGRALAPDNLEAATKEIIYGTSKVILIFPSSESMELHEALHTVKKRPHEKKNDSQEFTKEDDKITFIFIDATWKHAKEMYEKIKRMQNWPTSLVQAHLSSDAMLLRYQMKEKHKPNRFSIRSAPVADQGKFYLSTAECIAFVLSVVEENSELYDVLMKPLDSMVDIWNSYSKNKNQKNFSHNEETHEKYENSNS